MKRIPFSQVLKNADVDIRKEYDRLYYLFYKNKCNYNLIYITLHDLCNIRFEDIPFRDTCISLKDFEETHGFNFEEFPVPFDIDYLVSFCEYSYTLLSNLSNDKIKSMYNSKTSYCQQVLAVVEKIGYMPNSQGDVTDFVPKDQAAISVAEVVDSSLSYRVIEYNHHSMKGDLKRKKEVLIALANKLEPMRKDLKGINSKYESDLFTLFNSINIRHNNSDPDGNYFHSVVAEMTDEELESWYDDTYQMCLLAFLELEQVERKERVKQLKDKL